MDAKPENPRDGAGDAIQDIENTRRGPASSAEAGGILERHRQCLGAAFAINRLMLNFYKTCAEQQMEAWQRLARTVDSIVSNPHGIVGGPVAANPVSESVTVISAQLRDFSDLALRTNERVLEIVGDQVSNGLADVTEAISQSARFIRLER